MSARDDIAAALAEEVAIAVVAGFLAGACLGALASLAVGWL